MSVRSEPYIIAGYKLKKQFIDDINDSDELLDEFEKLNFPWCGKGAQKTLGILVDGMGNNYVLAGYCIDCGEEFDGLNFTEIDPMNPDSISQYKNQVDAWLSRNDLIKYLENGEFKLFILTHYH